MTKTKAKVKAPKTVEVDLSNYDDDPVVQQLSDIGQRVEIMLEAAGGSILDDVQEAATDKNADLPSDFRYQMGLSNLTDQIFLCSQLRRVLLRDEDDAADAEAEDSDRTEAPTDGAP